MINVLFYIRKNKIVRLFFLTITILFFGALWFYFFEKTPHIVDAFWWSFVTITTVGYGDSFPVTVEGRLVATVLMTVGVCLIGALAAYLASWFIEPEENKQDQALAEIRRELSEIRSLLERRVS